MQNKAMADICFYLHQLGLLCSNLGSGVLRSDKFETGYWHIGQTATTDAWPSCLSRQINNVGKFLTAQLVSCSRQQVVEDVEAPLLFSLTNSSRLLQQIWSHVSQEETAQ